MGQTDENSPRSVSYRELGAAGLARDNSFIYEAYNTALEWPAVYPLYSRLRRSDPEISVARISFETFSRQASPEWELPIDPTDEEKACQAWLYSVSDEIEGGISEWLSTAVSQVPFMGWGIWELNAGLRRAGWERDGWASGMDDGTVGIRSLAWRDQSSFNGWDLDNKGRVKGFNQRDTVGGDIYIPATKFAHLRFGDTTNPEGLTPLEAVYRLERIKYGLEVIMGIGFEHTAGHVSVNVEERLDDDAAAAIKAGAKAIMSAQEGNYAIAPRGASYEIIDANFSAAEQIINAIRYYGLLKLSVFQMDWTAISSVSGGGAYAARADASEMFINYFNAMISGFAGQLDRQMRRYLFSFGINKQKFNIPANRQPRLVFTKIDKIITLNELSNFIQAFAIISHMDEDDLAAIRQKSNILSEKLRNEQPPPREDIDTKGSPKKYSSKGLKD